MIEFYRQTRLNLVFGWLRVLGIIFGFLPFLLSIHASAGDFTNIGCGNPGLKVIAKQLDPNAVVIYHELPETPFGGFVGVFMTNENIQVIVDHGFGFHKDMNSFTSGIPLELYPFGTNSALVDEAGAMGIMRPPVGPTGPPEVGYKLIGSSLTIFTNVQEQARMKYHLQSNEVFLGSVNGEVFYCKENPAKVFWREPESQTEYYYQLPRAVVNIYGVTKAFDPHKDIGFVVLRPTPLVWPPWDNWFLPPRSDGFIEISLSNGKLVNPKE